MKMGKPSVALEIQNPGIFTVLFICLTNIKLNIFLEPSQRFKMEFFAKLTKIYDYCFKALYLSL